MIDFHCHILPGLDDGARSFDESLKMACIAESDGISEIVCTPHIKKGYATPTLRLIADRARDMQSRLQGAGISLRLHAAAEVALERNLADLIERGEIATIGGPVRYILLELPWARFPSHTETVISELIESGVTPIIAHLERYHEIIMDPDRARRFIEMGALVQVNSGSITGMFGPEVRATAHALVTHGTAHVIGSDAHSSGRRRPQMRSARETIARLLDEDMADRLTHRNAAEILAGKLLKMRAPQRYEGSRAPRWQRGPIGRIAFYVTRQLFGRR